METAIERKRRLARERQRRRTASLTHLTYCFCFTFSFILYSLWYSLSCILSPCFCFFFSFIFNSLLLYLASSLLASVSSSVSLCILCDTLWSKERSCKTKNTKWNWRWNRAHYFLFIFNEIFWQKIRYRTLFIICSHFWRLGNSSNI